MIFSIGCATFRMKEDTHTISTKRPLLQSGCGHLGIACGMECEAVALAHQTLCWLGSRDPIVHARELVDISKQGRKRHTVSIDHTVRPRHPHKDPRDHHIKDPGYIRLMDAWTQSQVPKGPGTMSFS